MDKAPDILLIKTPGGLEPYGRHSTPMLEDLVPGQVLTAKPRKGRGLPRNAAYWAGLHTAIEHCDVWPTTERLHADLKKYCGYVDEYFSPLTGQWEVRVQSTAFSKMNESEFAQYFRKAQLRFISEMGFDPWLQVAK
ncbi:hypothetical protein [Leisingera sp. ANG-Vp]|uniref:hypothetical protein n=1 Tax=Leisingera sp. ANG-Vp TaxID=1577896 RepID=UPI0005806387|nr:hypothetical protein [Leisingera sp. ANG-Vp]KIC22482.1 hypothetical protein RA20_00960 [Leisingera sp. ANG-Vp]